MFTMLKILYNPRQGYNNKGCYSCSKRLIDACLTVRLQISVRCVGEFGRYAPVNRRLQPAMFVNLPESSVRFFMVI